MAFTVTTRDVRDLQEAIQSVGQSVAYMAVGAAVARIIRARVRYLNAVELNNAVEAYPLEVTFDARDFAGDEPRKGDVVTIDEGRRVVMLVRQVRGSGRLIAYRCGVAG